MKLARLLRRIPVAFAVHKPPQWGNTATFHRRELVWAWCRTEAYESFSGALFGSPLSFSRLGQLAAQRCRRQYNLYQQHATTDVAHPPGFPNFRLLLKPLPSREPHFPRESTSRKEEEGSPQNELHSLLDPNDQRASYYVPLRPYFLGTRARHLHTESPSPTSHTRRRRRRRGGGGDGSISPRFASREPTLAANQFFLKQKKNFTY
ncbi:hypothetical protein LZ30DRAFT_191444 [Colletotrichum cereale]|nr:hypothetical protein LZ30DRAFT_191444 [Colletotrichum cereale]